MQNVAYTRNTNIDLLKGICIFFVVLIHVLQRTVPNFTSTSSWTTNIPYLLCVPTFFFLSGLSYSNKKTMNIKGFIYDVIKRTLMYFWPFLFFILLRIGIYNQWADVGDAFDKLMAYPVSGLWVCWILLFLSLLLDIGLFISNLFPNFKKVFVSIFFVIGMIIIITLRNTNVIYSDSFIGYNYFVIFAPIFLLGYLIGDYYFKLTNWKITLPISLAGFGSLIVICYFYRNFLQVNFYDDRWMYYLAIVSVLLTFLIIPVAFNYVPKVKNVIAYSGKFTLECYFVHLILLKVWSKLYFENPTLTWLTSIGLILLCYALTIAVIAISYFIPFLHFALFGKHYSYYKFENNFFDKIKIFAYSPIRNK